MKEIKPNVVNTERE